MNPEWKAKWIEALRSGKFRQGRGDLCSDDGAMCCLGVLRHIHDPKDTGSDCGWGEFLNTDQMGLFELSWREANLLTAMNDGSGPWAGRRQTFDQIADYIEENL